MLVAVVKHVDAAVVSFTCPGIARKIVVYQICQRDFYIVVCSSIWMRTGSGRLSSVIVDAACDDSKTSDDEKMLSGVERLAGAFYNSKEFLLIDIIAHMSN